MRFDLIGFETENPVEFFASSNRTLFFDTEQFAPDNSLGSLSSPIGLAGGITLGAFGGYLPFGFEVILDSTGTPHSATNAGNLSLSHPNIFMSMADDPTSRFGSSVYLAFDENLDGDYDDMFVRLTDVSTSTVPEPTALWLFGIGLAGLGVLRNRIVK
jgi:hypothetical protein